MMNKEIPLIVNKFGGGVINSASAVKHLPEVLKKHTAQNSINVFSAFGKTTNALEKAVKSYEAGEKVQAERLLDDLNSFHRSIASELFPIDHEVFGVVSDIFQEIKNKLSTAPASLDDKFLYDQIVPYGEILASLIVSHYLSHIKFPNKLINAADLIKTDSNFGSANVDKEATAENLRRLMRKEVLDVHQNIITQGFVGFSDKGMTTLGREGSDYTAGIIADLMNANRVVLYKDVPGVMTRNPKLAGNENARKIDFMTYRELEQHLQNGTATGLVHPKTLNEVNKKRIPIQVRPYWDLDSEGTLIS